MIDLATALYVALGGALGAAGRFVLAQALDGRTRPVEHLGTLVANLVGSLLLGWSAGAGLAGQTWAFAGVGFCGALTTYSSLAVQAFRLGPLRGGPYAVLSVVGAVVLAGLGFALGTP